MVAERVLYLGGAGFVSSASPSYSTPTNLAYEWTESQGWTKVGTLPPSLYYSNLGLQHCMKFEKKTSKTSKKKHATNSNDTILKNCIR